MNIKKIVEEWKIQDEEEEVARSEEKTKKLVPEQFHKWIKVFGKKSSKRMPMRKIQDKRNSYQGKRKCIPCLEKKERE